MYFGQREVTVGTAPAVSCSYSDRDIMSRWAKGNPVTFPDPGVGSIGTYRIYFDQYDCDCLVPSGGTYLVKKGLSRSPSTTLKFRYRVVPPQTVIAESVDSSNGSVYSGGSVLFKFIQADSSGGSYELCLQYSRIS